MNWFDYAAPRSLGEAVAILAAHPDARPLAGGTDLIVQLRSGRRSTSLVVDIKHVPELNQIRYDPAAGLTLGAAVPCYRIAEDPVVRRAYPSLAQIASLIGGLQIQSRASLGGNLCNASPSADSVPLLIALSAVCRIASAHGHRLVPVEDFCTAPGQTVLAPGELLVSFSLPPPPSRSGAHYLRFIPRNEMDIAVAGAGVWVRLDNGHIRDARVALAAVAPTPLLVPAAAEALRGQPPSPEVIDRAAQAARDAARPITDMRGTADFRRHLSAVLTRRALLSALAAAQEVH